MALVDLIVLSCNNCDINKIFIKNLKNNSDLSKIRVIWVDNGSTDSSIDYLKNNLPEDHVLNLQERNLGVINGRNIGWDISNSQKELSEYIMFLDNDQFVGKDWLESYLKLTNKYDLIGWEAWKMNNNFLPICRAKANEEFNYVGCGGMFLKREVSNKIGKFDHIFNPSYFEDPDYCMRVHKAGFKITWNKNSNIEHLPHQTLGKAADKNDRFIKSLKAFRNKWNGERMPSLK